jgi:trigger factor
MKQFASQLKAQGVSLDLYLQYTGTDQDALKATYLERAESEVKLRLALEKIAALEELSVSDEELEAEVTKLAEQNDMTPEDVKKRIYVEELRQDLLATKAMDLVKESAVATEAPAEEEKTEEAVATEE